ncbi:MAG: DUF2269 family protein [Magnetospirillum sp. WYHS-4]
MADYYLWLRFAHLGGAVLLGGGLLAVFVSELRSWRVADPVRFAEATWYTAVFYDTLALPGALLLAGSGLLLVSLLGVGYFDQPWLTGMWALFLFEFVEGNTVTRIQFRRSLRLARNLGSELTPEVRRRVRQPLGQAAHFLDLPLFGVILFCGAARPDEWWPILAALALALSAGGTMALVASRTPALGSASTP